MSGQETTKRTRGPRKTLEQQLEESLSVNQARERRLFQARVDAISKHDEVVSECYRLRAALEAIRNPRPNQLHDHTVAMSSAPEVLPLPVDEKCQ